MNQQETINLTGSTQLIEDSHIASGTREKYIKTLISFMIFLFEEHPEKLVNLEKLKEEDEKDTNRKRVNL
jgi:hypothetical protein